MRFTEREVRSQGDGRFLFSFRQDLEQQLGAPGIQLDVAELVQAQQVDPPVTGHQAGQAPFVGRFGQFVDELGTGGVTDAPASLTSSQAEADQQVALARAAVAQQHDGVPGAQVGTAGQGRDGGRVHGGGCPQVKVGQARRLLPVGRLSNKGSG